MKPMKTVRTRIAERAREREAARKPSALSTPALLSLGKILLDAGLGLSKALSHYDVCLNTLDTLGVTAAVARARHTEREAAAASYRRPVTPAPPLPVGIVARIAEVNFRVGLLTPNELDAYTRRMNGEPA